MGKRIRTETAYVLFDFGSWAYVGVDIHEGNTFEQDLRIRSSAIVGYIRDHKFVMLSKEA